MRRFHSYGPVDCEEHFCVPRRALVEHCIEQLVGQPNKKGHYFTVWAPRQTGKTWLMHQVVQEIQERYGDRFILGTLSMQEVVVEEESSLERFLEVVPLLILNGFDREIETPKSWEEWTDLFHQRAGLFDRPVLLFIDEFDSLPPRVIDRLVALFRGMHLKRQRYLLHGLGLIGVRAVLGVESERGSPFNIQRSLHVPNLTREEVVDLFDQYQEESGQAVDSAVVGQVFRATRGQPGLVSWFGELLTETYNPGEGRPIDLPTWELVYGRARRVEWNNTLLNLIKKARGTYLPHVMELFNHSNIEFSLRTDWCSYLYLNGIIDFERGKGAKGEDTDVCRFSSPFVQQCIYQALTYDLVGDRTAILALEPLDDLADVFGGPRLDLPALLRRYKDYLVRLEARGLDPWKEQPRRRKDLRLTEAVGHFHLYTWLHNALGRRCVVSPEFPTGNGKVDLHLRCEKGRGIIEVKSFRDIYEARESVKQAAQYGRDIGVEEVTLALFVPVKDEEVLAKLSWEEAVEGVKVTVVAIGWA